MPAQTKKRRKRATSHRKILIAMLIVFGVEIEFYGLAGSPSIPTNQSPAVSSKSLPSRIVTSDGKIYSAVKLIKVQPDGLLVSYSPASGGFGLANLKFTTLPKSLQNQFGYDPERALEFETNQMQAMSALSQKLRQDEKVAAAAQADTARVNFIWRISNPTVTYSIYDHNGPRPPQLTNEPAEMTGMTYPHINFEPDFAFRWRQEKPNEPFIFHIEAATISLGLSISITLPDNASDKLKAHEEGHRKINEHFYGFTQKIITDAIDAMADEGTISNIKDLETAKHQAAFKSRNELQTRYLNPLWDVLKQANVRYDELTDHGRNNVDSDEAVQRVIAEYDSKVFH